MGDIVKLALDYPLIFIVIFCLNSVSMVWIGIWLGTLKAKFATKEYLRAALKDAEDAADKVHDDMAHRYQQTMESTAERMKEILDSHTSRVADFLTHAAEEGEESRKIINSLTKDTFQIKGALAVLLPKGAAAQIFTSEA